MYPENKIKNAIRTETSDNEQTCIKHYAVAFNLMMEGGKKPYQMVFIQFYYSIGKNIDMLPAACNQDQLHTSWYCLKSV